VYLLSAGALFILLISSLNFFGLTIARLTGRSMEVAVRKVFGATRRQLMAQFLTEALVLTLLALGLAAMVVELLLPHLDAALGTTLAGGYASSAETWFTPAVAVIIVGLAAGCYPAFVLSSLRWVHNAATLLKAGRRRLTFWRVMVVTQVALTTALAIVSLIIRNQLDFVRNRPLGLDKDQVIVVPIRDENLRQHPDILKTRLLSLRGVRRVGAAALLPGGPVGRTPFHAEGVTGTMSMLWVDPDFLDAVGIEVLAGRGFSQEFGLDQTEAFLVNEEAARQLGWTNPANAVGRGFEITGGKRGRIIGVTANFNFASLRRVIEPIVIHLWPWSNYILARTDGSDPHAILEGMKGICEEADPANPFTYTFLSENFERHYVSDRQLGSVVGSLTIPACLLACSGLLTLIVFTTEQRTREIGIRKVLGASTGRIAVSLAWDTLSLVILANVLIWPPTYYLVRAWLNDFAYRTDLGFNSFLLAGAGSLLLALLAVGYRTVRSALANPVESLRHQ
jgi:putative ABC transport system permease protein